LPASESDRPAIVRRRCASHLFAQQKETASIDGLCAYNEYESTGSENCMASKISDERLAAAKKIHEEMRRYRELFRAAFDELHQAVVLHVKTSGQYVGPHHDYPTMSFLDSGFPSFRDVGFYENSAPRDYVGSTRPHGFLSILSGRKFPEISFPKGAELAVFLRSHEIGKRLGLKEHVYEGKELNASVDYLVDYAVERYLHLYGLDASIDGKRRDNVVRPLIFGTVFRKLDLRLVVPITMTNFDVDHFPLTETTFIARLPKRIQLARARVSTRGTGAVQSVVGAATHAFVSNDWTLEVDNIDEVRKSLGQSSANVLDAIDSFFGALRVATGISTGYAQVLWVPRKWALEYFCDLTPLYGTATRQYPSDFDNYGWTRSGATVTLEQLKDVRRIYCAVLSDTGEAVRLALKRLNGCLTRTDAADAILDGTIGLELLLGDDQSQSLAYKLRLRAAALAILHANPAHLAKEVASKVKRLYEARSAIVHGRRKKRSKKASEPVDTSHLQDRLIASDLLRFVLDVLLTHPEYQDPSKIDEGLLLRGDDVGDGPNALASRRGHSRKSKRITKKDGGSE